MKIRFFIWILSVLFAALNVSAEENLMFNKANQLYHNKNYDSAAKLYQQMIHDGYCHPDLYYNAGNAFYRTHEIGMAIWCYRKAQTIHSNPHVKDNLALAQRRIKEPIQEVKDIFFMRWWKSAYSLFSVNQWALFSLVFFLVGILIQSLRRFNVTVKLPVLFSRVLLIMSFIAIGFTLVAFHAATNHYHGILVGKSILFKEKSNNSTTTLSEGIEVECVEAGTDKLKVKLPDGRVGFVDAKVFRKI